VASIIKFIENSPEVPLNNINNIVHAQQTTTLFGIQIITIDAQTDKGNKVKAVASYNPLTGEVNLNDCTVQ